MSANRGAWVGDRAFRCHETERSVFLFANTAAVVPREVLEEAVFFANHQSPIAAANEETRLRRVMLAPYGDWPNTRGLQKFQKPDAEVIVKEFSNVINKLTTPSSWLGLPWYEGHPDHPDFRGKPGHTRSTAVGRIKSLEAGPDGLYANVKFNDDGESLIRNESYHGHSVNWFLTRDPQGNGYRPFRLKSVGFTNEPNIPVPAVTLANAGTTEGAKKGWEKKFRHAPLMSLEHFKRNRPQDETYNRKTERGEEEVLGHEIKHGDLVEIEDDSSWGARVFRMHSSSANSRPSRFQVMSQMRWMANGAPIGNKNAFGKHHNWFVSGHKESIDFHKPKAEYYEGLAHLGDEYKELAKFHRKRADFHQEELSKLLSANSQSRFSVLRGMREALNVPKHQANLQHSQQK